MQQLTVSAAAHALGIEVKEFNNLVARDARSLVAAGRQGRGRRISTAVLEQIAVALVLRRDLGIPVSRGLPVAEKLLETSVTELPAGSLVSLRFDVQRLRTVLAAATAEVLEELVPPRRGRPPTGRKTRRGAS